MTKKKDNTQIAVINKDNLPAAPSMLEILKAELAGLKTITETSYKTEGNFDGFPTNLQTETKIENLVRLHSSVMGRAKAYSESQTILAKKLGSLEIPVFKINGNTPEAIEADIILRIQVINVSERKAELEALVKEGEAFLTKEDQYNMYLAKVSKVVGSN